jgi:hypothetical protein
VFGADVANGLELDDDQVRDEEVETVRPREDAAVPHLDLVLTPMGDRTLQQFERQRRLVDGFDEPWPEPAVDVDRSADDRAGQLGMYELAFYVPSYIPGFLSCNLHAERIR